MNVRRVSAYGFALFLVMLSRAATAADTPAEAGKKAVTGLYTAVVSEFLHPKAPADLYQPFMAPKFYADYKAAEKLDHSVPCDINYYAFLNDGLFSAELPVAVGTPMVVGDEQWFPVAITRTRGGTKKLERKVAIVENVGGRYLVTDVTNAGADEPQGGTFGGSLAASVATKLNHCKP